MKHFWIAISLFLWASIALQAQSNYSLNGYVRNFTALGLSEPNEFAIGQNTLDLTLKGGSSRASFTVNPFLYHYYDNELEWGLREAYVDLYFNNWDLRVGKQQIIWGKAEGVFITDMVAPKDLRLFLMPDFEEIRMGVTAVKLNYYRGMHSFEAVWIPFFTPTLMPEAGSMWTPQMPFPVQPRWDYSLAQVDRTLENSELFFRYSLLSSYIDLEWMGGSFLYDDPMLSVQKQIDPLSQQLLGITLLPEYKRVNMTGGSFSLPIADWVVRGEAAYYQGREFQINNPEVPSGLSEHDFLHYMVGVDYSLAGVKLSAQLIQENILDYQSGLVKPETRNTMTFLARKDFLRERLWLELFTYIGLDEEDALIRPKLSYLFYDGVEFVAGANLFAGNQGQFGQYESNDMVYFKLKYSF